MVMVIDDDADIRAVISSILEDAGYQVVEAASGQAALSLLADRNGQPCLVLLDLMMPGMTGTEVGLRLRSDPRWHSVPIVVISGAAGAVERGQQVGAATTMIKPFEMDALLATVARYC
jgi:CheY-like chemotaxis protein